MASLFGKLFSGLGGRRNKMEAAPVSSISVGSETFHINLEERSAIVEEFREIVMPHVEKISSDGINDCYFNLPVRKNVVLLVGLGKNVRGNLQYILNELNHNDAYEGMEIYVRVSAETEPIVQNYIQANGWKNTRTVLKEKEYRQLMESAGFLITEVYFPESWIKKPGQIYISIWHGTPLKKLGLAKNSNNSHKNGVTQKNFIDADYLLYPNDYTRTHMLASYKVAPLMKGQTLMLGYPRTGGMMQAAQEDLTELKKRLAPNGEKIYAYMPTFKDYLKGEEVVRQAKELLDYLDASMGEEQILYVNLHHKINAALDYSSFKKIHQFPPDVDSYRLLAASEALLTDYSSVFYDYLALRKHIILYVADYDLYKTKRGTYMELSELPFDMAKTKEEVLAAMNRGKTYDDQAAFDRFCAYDSPENARKLCSILTGKTEDLDLAPVPEDPRKKILLYSLELEDGAQTRLLHRFTQSYDRAQAEVFIGCGLDDVDDHKDGAYPLLFENAAFGTGKDPHLTGLGRAVLKLYKEKKLTFDKAMEYLKYDYAIMSKRMFSRSDFARAVIYDVTDPGVVLALAEMEIPKILFLSQIMLDKIASGDMFLKDAVIYSAKYCESVCTISEKLKKQACRLLSASLEDQIQVADTPEKLNQLIIH